MRLGILGYTNRTSGCGVFAGDLVDNVPVDSYFSVPTPKGQEKWMERQVNGHPGGETLAQYLDRFRPDVLLGIETMFSGEVCPACRKRGIKTALIVMHEAYFPGKHAADHFLCPVQVAYDKVEAVNKVYFDWPMDIRPFTFSERTEARRFLHVMGYAANGLGFNRRQTREVYEGFSAVDAPDISLTVHCQEDWRVEYGECQDPRVTFRLATLPTPAEVYEGFDVLIQPDAYAGYNRVLLEAKACGLPVLTTDAPPMNQIVHDPEALIPAESEWFVHADRLNCYRYRVTADAVAEAIKRTLTWDIPQKSRRARKCAEARAWTEEKRADFLRLLETMVN